MISRRQWLQGALGGSLSLAACSPRKGTGFPGYAIIASEAEQTLSAINLQRFRLIRQLKLESAPSQVMAISDPARVVCLLPHRGMVITVDSEAVAVRQKLRVGDESLTMRLADDGKRVWILNKSPNTLVSVDLSTFTVASRVRLPGPAASVDFHLKTGAVTLPSHGAIAIIEDDRVSRAIATGMAPEMVCFRSNGETVMAADPDAQMMAVGDPANGQLIVKLSLPLKPRHYCYKPDGGQLFLTGDGMDAVAIVSPYQTEVFETILAGRAPAGMAVPTDPDLPEYLLVTNAGSGDLTVIDISTRRVVARIPVGQDPEDVVITPDSQYALVLNRKSGDIAVIRIPSIGAWGNHKNRTAPLFTMIPVGLSPVSGTVSRVG
jgi:YVTN family beta-propeller protein